MENEGTPNLAQKLTMSGQGPSKSELIAFFVNWDEDSFRSLRENLFRIDKLVPEWIHLADPDGTIVENDQAMQSEVAQYLRQHRPNLPIIPLINNFNSQTMTWDELKLSKMLGNPEARRRTNRNLLDYVRRNGFGGVCLDFENLRPASQPDLMEFLHELSEVFHFSGLQVCQVVHLEDLSFNYRAAAQFIDYFILVAYEEHPGSGQAGPLASQGWYARGLKLHFSELTPEKFVIALGNYGYDWEGNKKESKMVSFQEMIKIAQESKGEIKFHPLALNPNLAYSDSAGHLHRLWFLDAVTAFNQLVEGQRHRPLGFALWRLGSEDPSIWPILDRRSELGKETAETLRSFRVEDEVVHRVEGEEEIRKNMRDGEREITYDPGCGLVTREHMVPFIWMKSQLIGFFVNWDEKSFRSLQENLFRLDKLIAEWLHLAGSDGSLKINDPKKQTEVTEYIRENRSDLSIIPLINNFDPQTMKWEGSKLGKMLGNPNARSRTIQNLLKYVRSNGLGGVCIDFEDIPQASHPALNTFMRELYGKFHSLGLEVSQSVPLTDESFDYKTLVGSNDYLILMAYDEHWGRVQAGPVASQPWYAYGLQRRFGELPSWKCVVAIGSYGYDWEVHKSGGKIVSFPEAIRTAQQSRAEINFDPVKLNPTFHYQDSGGKLHQVWFLDAVTAFNQVVEAQRHHPRGFALWRLGSEDPSIWSTMDVRSDPGQQTAEALRTFRIDDLPKEKDAGSKSANEQEGLREIIYDVRSGMINSARVISFPPEGIAAPALTGGNGGSDTSKMPSRATPSGKRPWNRSELMGFFVNWDEKSFRSLQENLFTLDRLIPEWLHLTTSDGTVMPDDKERQDQAIRYIRKHRPDLSIIPLVNNFDSQTQGWEGIKVGQMMEDSSARWHTIQNLLEYIRGNGFAGICIDFKNVPLTSQPALFTFMQELYGRFHPLGLEVSQIVPFDDPLFDYRAASQYSDYLILTAHDEHGSGRDPGPLASQEWYSRILRHRLGELPSEKCVIAIGNCGYDWETHQTTGRMISFPEALDMLKHSKEKVRFDPLALNPTFDYYDQGGNLHHVWFLDAVTAFNELVTGQRYHPRGFALWRLGVEDSSIWPIFKARSRLGRGAIKMLRNLRFGYEIRYRGEGEILRVNGDRDGLREITYDERSGMASMARIISFPSPYEVLRWGKVKGKKVALTFDDGPDRTYTPQVLDVLRRYQVPATFFVIGRNIEKHPELLQRIMKEGHEIGNHTMTHLNVTAIPLSILKVELNATERLFESRLGIRSLLFRSPYGVETDSSTMDSVRPFPPVSELGYYIVGGAVDPNDWHTPGVEHITRWTINSVLHGDGSIVILHDGGGDRSQTVAALPRIIEELRGHNFEFVPVSNLLGVRRQMIMPPVSTRERIISRVGELSFLLLGWFLTILRYFVMFGIGLSLLRFLSILGVSLYEWGRKPPSHITSSDGPAVSVIIPAYNEGKVIVNSIRALLRSDYPNFDIIVVDDGSKDGTYQSVVRNFCHDSRVQAYNRPNRGKVEALNFGIRRTCAEILILQDADTVFRPDTISKLVRHFVDPSVGAVAGNAKVGNRTNLLTSWQALEYITNQNLDRRAFHILNCINVVPGCVGAWRRKLILEAGGFANDTLAEDADLTLTILRMGYRVIYEPEAVGWTEAPDTVGGLLKQRFRWTYGILQAGWKHRAMLFRPCYGSLGWIAVPNMLLWQTFFLFLSPIFDFWLLLSPLWLFWGWTQKTTSPMTEVLHGFLFYYILFLTVEFLAALVAFLREPEEDWKLLLLHFLQRFFYRQLLYYVGIKSILTAIHGWIVAWTKIERKATVQGTL